jgi:hypothetical protein
MNTEFMVKLLIHSTWLNIHYRSILCLCKLTSVQYCHDTGRKIMIHQHYPRRPPPEKKDSAWNNCFGPPYASASASRHKINSDTVQQAGASKKKEPPEKRPYQQASVHSNKTQCAVSLQHSQSEGALLSAHAESLGARERWGCLLSALMAQDWRIIQQSNWGFLF